MTCRDDSIKREMRFLIVSLREEGKLKQFHYTENVFYLFLRLLRDNLVGIFLQEK